MKTADEIWKEVQERQPAFTEIMQWVNIHTAMKEYARQAIEEAAERANVLKTYEGVAYGYSCLHRVNKQSILKIIDELK